MHASNASVKEELKPIMDGFKVKKNAHGTAIHTDAGPQYATSFLTQVKEIVKFTQLGRADWPTVMRWEILRWGLPQCESNGVLAVCPPPSVAMRGLHK